MKHRTKEPWHTMRAVEIERRLKTDIRQGLSPRIGRSRLEHYGYNELFWPVPCDLKTCIRRILSDISLWVLVIVCLVALCFSRFATALSILLVLASSCAVSVAAYVKTNRIKESMSRCSVPHVHVVRGGEVVRCSAGLLVPGDILLLEAGDVIPCDARLLVTEGGFTVRTCVIKESGETEYVTTV